MLKIPGVYVDFKGDLTELKRDFRKVRTLAKEAGTDISNGMKNAVLPNTISRSYDQLYQNLVKINRVAVLSSQDLKKVGITLDKDLIKNINMTEKEFASLQRRMLNTKATQQAERAIKSLGRQANLSAVEMALLRRKVGDTKGAFRELYNFSTSHLSKIAGIVTGTTLAIGAMAYAVNQVNKMIWTTGRETAVAERAYTEITGSVAGMNDELAFLRELADELGLSFYTLRDGYIGFLAAAKDSRLPMEEARKVFKSVSRAAAILGLSNDRVKYTFMALEQMMSKGKVSMEELRRQMGDNLYGAFQKAAKAMGISTEELDAMISKGELFTDDFLPRFREVLDQDFTGSVADAVRAENRFQDAWIDLKNEMADSGFMESATTALSDFAETFKDPEVIEGVRAMAKALGQTLEVMAKLSKYAGLRSIIGTTSEGAELSKQGRLGIPFDEFMRKGFFERQKIVDEANALIPKEYSPHWENRTRIDIPEAPKPAAKPSGPSEKELKKQQREAEKRANRIKSLYQESYSSLDTINQETYDTILARYKTERDEFIKLTGDKETAIALYHNKLDALNEKTMSGMLDMESFDWESKVNVSSRITAIREEEQASSERWKRDVEAMNKAMAEEERIYKEFQESYKQATLSATDYQLHQLHQRYENYSKHIDDKAQVDEWYNAEVKRILDEQSSDWENAFTGWANSYSRTLTDMVWGADISFSKIAESFGRMLTEMYIQKQIMQPILDFDWGGAIGGLVSSVSGWGGGATVADGTGVASNWSGHVQMANGGIINEHVVGVGLSSGASYEFGEGGVPEAVLPQKYWGGAGGSGRGAPPGGTPILQTINIHEAEGTKARAEHSDDGQTLNILIEQVEGAMTGRINRGAGLAPFLDSRYGRRM